MTYYFINLKRFDVPNSMGGLNRVGDPVAWIDSIVRRAVKLGLASNSAREICYLVPEGLLSAAVAARNEAQGRFSIGCQSVYRDDVGDGGNFGAFTSLSPAAAVAALGAEWAIVGHSEERRDKLDILARLHNVNAHAKQRVVDEVLSAEALRAHRRGLKVLFCIGETLEERGSGDSEEVLARVRDLLRLQIVNGIPRDSLDSVTPNLVLGYEPIWAIGPGRTPPSAVMIDRIAAAVKGICREEFDAELPVVYGGGLKEANARGIGSAPSVDGGLVALTRFEPPIGFDTDDLAKIIDMYEEGAADANRV